MRSDKKPGRAADAYFTLEASFLVPMTFFLFAFIIHMAFQMYGRALLVPDAYLLALRASLLKEDADVEAFVRENASVQLVGKYFGNVQPQVSVRKEGKYVLVTLESATRRSAEDLAARTVWDIRATARALQTDVPKRIRRIDRIADLALLAAERLRQGEGE